MSAADIDTVARTLYGEARGSGADGMSAVACVIMNRCRVAQQYVTAHGKPHPEFGDGTPQSCCWMDEQFSCWDDDDPNLDVIENVTSADPVFQEAMEIAGAAVAGTLPDTTSGATFYYAKSMPQPPYWAKGKTPCADIGGQRFFNNIQ
ncbi:MAG TPA: cell wall hydrolase [Bryobacteraceae bacterium]|jgi:spore germination cell wall hydrolase CwlJ-like protein|nr:cell wall hydrolase [Bryobacteraceae bacterium]